MFEHKDSKTRKNAKHCVTNLERDAKVEARATLSRQWRREAPAAGGGGPAVALELR